MNPKISFKKKVCSEHLSAFPLYSLTGHTNKHLLATHQELSTLSTEDIIITEGFCIDSFVEEEIFEIKFMRWRRNVDRAEVLNIRNGQREDLEVKEPASYMVCKPYHKLKWIMSGGRGWILKFTLEL